MEFQDSHVVADVSTRHLGQAIGLVLTLGGLINPSSLRPLLRWLIRHGYPGTAMELLRLPLNLIGVRALFREARAA